MGQARDYEALIRELLAGVAGGCSYGNVIVLLMTKGVDESDLALWLREFAEGLSLERDRELIEQLKLLGKMTPGKLASEALEIAAKFDRSDEQGSELLNHEVWFDQGNELYELGRYDESISSFDQAIKINPEYSEAWFERGITLDNLGQYEEAIASFNQAIKINSNCHLFWYSRGIVLVHLEQHEEAITSYENAIEINPELYQAWNNKGFALDRLERHEEAIASYNHAIEIDFEYSEDWLDQDVIPGVSELSEESISIYERIIELNPKSYKACVNKGFALDRLGRYEEAIASYNQAIEINPNFCKAWSKRGIALGNLEQYEEAIASFNRAIELDYEYSEAWYNKGSTLDELGQHQKAIASYEQSVKIRSDFYPAWHNRGINIGILKEDYQAEIDAYREAFEHIYRDTHPEGWGYLQHKIGRTHYQEGISQLFNHQRNPQSYYDRALTHYHNALQTFTSEEFPKLRLDTLIDTAKVYLAQHNTPTAHQCKTEAFEIFQNLLNAQPTFEGKKRLQLEYTSLRQLDVDLFIANGDNANALVAAELEKNNRLTWLLSVLAEKTISPSYAQMRQLLGIKSASTTFNIRGLDRAITLPLAKNSPTGIVYWHLSPDNLTTFTLTANDSQPLVWESDRRQQAQQLSKRIKEWDSQYRDYGSKKSVATQPSSNGEVLKDEKEHHPWRKNLPDYLEQLEQILEIDKICAQLPTTLTHLILIPHGDLHRFPLHTLFLTSAKLPNLQSCTYLPSIQIGLNLQQRSNPNRSYAPFLSVEDPETHQDKMPFAQIESTIVRHLLQPNTHINSVSANLATVENALRQPHASFHFTGHAAYNSRSPEASALALTDEPLTAKLISQLDLSSYNLITLAACETAITGRANINTEYIGLSSAFLQAGAANVFSTLWQVDEIASTWFTIYFYQQLLSGKSPAEALAITQRWLQAVTWQSLADWLTEISQLPQLEIGIIDRLTARITNILKEGGTIGLNRPTKYSHPYYWAAFTLTGEG